MLIKPTRFYGNSTIDREIWRMVPIWFVDDSADAEVLQIQLNRTLGVIHPHVMYESLSRLGVAVSLGLSLLVILLLGSFLPRRVFQHPVDFLIALLHAVPASIGFGHWLGGDGNGLPRG